MTIRELLHSRAMLFETPADGGTGAPPAAPTFDPTPDPTPPSPGTPATETPSPGTSAPWANAPWAETLEARFEDPAQREAVHGYLQEEIQPYVTRREQELGGLSEMWEALDDQEQSLPTFLTIAEEKYGPEVAQVFADAILQHVQAQQEGSDPANPSGDAPETYEEWYEKQPPWIQEREDVRLAEEEDGNYESEVQQHAPDVVALGQRAQEHFGRYVLALEGDVAAAKQLWDQEMGPIVAAARQDPSLAASLGFELGEPQGPAGAASVPGNEAAPHVLGATGAGGGTAPPTVPQYGSMDEVYADFYSEVAGKSAGGLE
jgi:hypothetical protein